MASVLLDAYVNPISITLCLLCLAFVFPVCAEWARTALSQVADTWSEICRHSAHRLPQRCSNMPQLFAETASLGESLLKSWSCTCAMYCINSCAHNCGCCHQACPYGSNLRSHGALGVSLANVVCCVCRQRLDVASCRQGRPSWLQTQPAWPRASATCSSWRCRYPMGRLGLV